MNILIVGAGPTGLTAGLELARRGITPTIVDKRESASTLSRAVGITSRSLEILSRSGAAERLIEEGIAMEGLKVYVGDRLVMEVPLYSDRTYYQHVLGLAQDRTEAIMADTLTSLGVAVRYGVAVVGLTENSDQVIVRYSDDTEEAFEQVIGADGTRSTVREQAGIGYPGHDLPQIWSIADVDCDDWRHPGRVTVVRAAPGKTIVVGPLGSTRYRLVASDEDAIEALPLPMNIKNVRSEGKFTISVRQAETYSKGRVHLAGDAAHCHVPIGGRGMNLGIADAAELTKQLIEGGDMDEYSSIRHSYGAATLKVTERGRKMAGGINLPRRAAFRLLTTVVNAIGPVKRRLGRFLVEF